MKSIAVAGQRYWAVLLATSCLLIGGCSGSGPNVVLDTPTGVVPLDAPSPTVMPGGLAGPPPGLDNPAAPAGAMGSGIVANRSGIYAGNAVPLDTGGGICLQDQPVSGFRVRGNAVRFGRYRGTIAPDGGLQMVNGDTWIVGQFVGATFRGQVDMNQGFGNPMCTYMMTLQRVGP